MLVATRLAAGFRDEVIISPDPRICMQRGSQCSAHIVFREGDEEDAGEPKDARLDFKELLMLAIATSIDALAVGITFAFLGVNIVVAIAVIGVTTFVLSVVGVAVGHAFGARYEKGATIAGGIVLILIGCKILLEHLGFIAL